MLREISFSAVDHISNYSAAIPFVLVLLLGLGISYASILVCKK